MLQEVTHSDEDDLDHPESALDEGTPISEGTNEKSVIGSAADAVINIVKKAVNVLGKRGNSYDSTAWINYSIESKFNNLLNCVLQITNKVLLTHPIIVKAYLIAFPENPHSLTFQKYAVGGL